MTYLVLLSRMIAVMLWMGRAEPLLIPRTHHLTPLPVTGISNITCFDLSTTDYTVGRDSYVAASLPICEQTNLKELALVVLMNTLPPSSAIHWLFRVHCHRYLHFTYSNRVIVSTKSFHFCVSYSCFNICKVKSSVMLNVISLTIIC